MSTKLLCISVLIILSCGISWAAKSRDRNTKPYTLVCYFGAWSYWRKGLGKITPDDFSRATQNCTHMVYGFSVMRDDKIIAHDPYLDLPDGGEGSLNNYGKFNDQRKKNPDLTTLIAIGGWNEGFLEHDHKYSKMAADPAKRKVFINSVLDFLKKYDFDGLDFDWEYPALREGVFRPEDKINFVTILKELKEAFEPHGYLLTAAVAAGVHTVKAAYDIPQVSKYLDLINIMVYDLHGTWENYTGHNSPLFERDDESEDDKKLNVNYAIQNWISEGADKNKITLGLPLYGRCYTLADKAKTGYGALTTGNGTEGIYTGLPGMQGYNELCLRDKKEEGWTVVWNSDHLAYYIYKDDQWCSYDDPESIRIKVEYIRAMKLKGAMVWSIDTDDFRGQCLGTQFPLIKTIVDELQNPKEAQLPKRGSLPMSTTPWPLEPTTVPPPPRCQEEGLFAIPENCKKFLRCAANGGSFEAFEFDCPTGLVFNPKITACDYPHNVPSCM